MKFTQKLALAATASVLLSGLTSQATPTKVASTSYNGHVYDLYADTGITWANAKQFAEDQGGYLAVLTTTTEITTVYGGLIGHGFFNTSYKTPQEGQLASAWVGGYPANMGSTTDKYAWKWVTGEAWTADDVANWSGSEPNGDSGGLTINRYGNYKWNDDKTVGGFIVEVPDAASTLALMGGAFALIGAYNRKFRK